MSRSRKSAPRIDTRQRVYDGYFKIDEVGLSYDRVGRPGRVEGQRRLILERGDSAAVLLHDIEADTILLSEQVRAPTIDKGPGIIREIVAGSVEPGETAEACIVRELEEEIGYRVGKSTLKPIGTFYVSPGGTSERVVLFYARVKARHRVNPSATGLAREGEDVALVRVPRDIFVKRALAGRIDDAKTLIAGLWLATRNES